MEEKQLTTEPAARSPSDSAATGSKETQSALVNILEDLDAAYARLKTESSRTQVVLETMGSVLVSLDSRGVLELANHEAVTLFGWEKGLPKRSLITQEPFATVIRECGSDLKKPCQTVYSKGEAHYKAVGKAIALEGSVKGFVVVLVDITKEKELDRLKTEFVSITSHQLRTPLSAIKWILELVLHGGAGQVSPETREFLEQAHSSNERMIALIGELLNISRIEAGKLTFSPVAVDLAVLTKYVLREYEAAITEKKITLVVDFPKEMPLITADPNHLHQVISNLVSNAVKYSFRGGKIVVFVTAKNGDVVWSVKDSGMGIPAVQHHRVFQKFFRGDNVVREETEGTGLGLYVAKALIDASGGRIWFTSEEGKGSTFFFSFTAKKKRPSIH